MQVRLTLVISSGTRGSTGFGFQTKASSASSERRCLEMVDWVVKSRSAVLEKLKVLASTENSFRYSSSIRSILKNVTIETIDKKILKEKDSPVNNSILELF